LYKRKEKVGWYKWSYNDNHSFVLAVFLLQQKFSVPRGLRSFLINATNVEKELYKNAYLFV
jgi:hypothetical protein